MTTTKSNNLGGAITICPICNLTTATHQPERVGSCFVGKDLISCMTGGSGSPEDAAPQGWTFIGRDALGEFNYERDGRHDATQKILADSSDFVADQQEQLASTTDLINEFAQYNKQRLNLREVYLEPLGSDLHKAAMALPIAPECVHQVFIAIAASLIGTKAKLKINDTWSEPAILWTGFVSPPGTRKSPCMNVSRRPLVDLQQEAIGVYREQEADYQKKVRNWEGMSKAEKKAAALFEVPLKPHPRNYYLEDTTIEATVEAHCQPESITGFALTFDELSELFSGMDQYKNGKGSDRQKILRLWGGGDLKVNRKSVEPLFIPSSAVSITGGIQPGVLEQLMGDGEDEDGMWGRFLWSAAPPLGAEHRQASLGIDPSLKALYKELDELKPQSYTFHPDATKLFFKVELALEAMMTGSPVVICQVLSKLVGYTGRLALVLHCIDLASGLVTGLSTQIPIATLQRAVILVDYYYRQVRVLYGKGAASELPAELMRLVAWSQSLDGKHITTRDVVTRRWAKTSKDAHDLFEQLVTLGVGELSNSQKGAWQWRFTECAEVCCTLLHYLSQS